jgi:hypothetical protein
MRDCSGKALRPKTPRPPSQCKPIGRPSSTPTSRPNLSRKAARADRTGRLAGRQRRLAPDARTARRHRRVVAEGQRAGGRPVRAPAVVLGGPPRPGAAHPLRRPADGPRVHLAGPRPAAGRRPPAQGRRGADRADPGHRRPLPLRDLHLAVLPQLPGRGAGAQPDGGAQSERRGDHGRRRPVPAGGRGARHHGGAGGVRERRTLRPGPHDARGDRGEAGYRRRGEGGRGARRQGALRRAGGRRRPGRRRGGDLRREEGHPHRRGGRALRRPGARHAGDRELRLGEAHRGAAARRGAGEATSGSTAWTSCRCSAPRRWCRAKGCTK